MYGGVAGADLNDKRTKVIQKEICNGRDKEDQPLSRCALPFSGVGGCFFPLFPHHPNDQWNQNLMLLHNQWDIWLVSRTNVRLLHHCVVPCALCRAVLFSSHFTWANLEQQCRVPLHLRGDRRDRNRHMQSQHHVP